MKNALLRKSYFMLTILLTGLTSLCVALLTGCSAGSENGAGITNTGNTTRISGVVRGDYEVAALQVYLGKEAGVHRDSTRTDDSGRYEFTGMDVGRWVVTVRHGDSEGSVPVELESGVATAQIDFQVNPSSIVGTVVLVDVGVSSSSSSIPSSSSQTPPGSYSVAPSSWCALAGNCGTFVDERDQQSYRWTRINGVVWMAQNLNYMPAQGTSLCYDNTDANCAIYGRLYRWSTAMALEVRYDTTSWTADPSLVQGICPAGWRIPLYEEWMALGVYVHDNNPDTTVNSASRLRASSDLWTLAVNSGTDDYGFSDIPGGYYIDAELEYEALGFFDQGQGSLWWAASEVSSNSAGTWPTAWLIDDGKFFGGISGDKRLAASLRCVRNAP